MAALLTSQGLLAQQNIGEFNQKETDIRNNLWEVSKTYQNEYSAIVRNSRNYTDAEIYQHIGKMEQLISNMEQRLQLCQNALRTLPESSSIKTNNIEFKFWTESLIESYQSSIVIEKSRIGRYKKIDLKGPKSSDQNKTNEQAPQHSSATQKTTAHAAASFWNDQPAIKNSDKVISKTSLNAHVPEFTKTSSGGYYQKGSDGQLIAINQDDYYRAQLKSKSNQQQKEMPTPQNVNQNVTALMNSLSAEQNTQQVIYDNITQKFDGLRQLYQQNYYAAEAVRTGKSNLDDLSTISGNNKSVQEIEYEFNRKNRAIRAEVYRIQEARNAQTANAVAYNYAGATGTEQAIGLGIQTLSTMINAGVAQKEEREAKEALKRERDQQIAAFEAAQLKARIEVRQNLIHSFPHGGTPITSHKVTEPEVYFFAYFVDETEFPNQSATITVSNVFKVYKFDDGTYPYVTSVSSKLRGFGAGRLVLVGYYLQKAQVAQMHTSFVNLAKESDFIVKEFTFGMDTAVGKVQVSADDFWENKNSANKPTKETSAYWDQ